MLRACPRDVGRSHGGRAGVLLASLTLLLNPAAFGAAAAKAAPTGKASAPSQLNYGETTRLDSFDPYTAPEAAAQRLSDLLFDPLVDIGPGGEYEPALAQSWQILNGGTQLNLVLRSDVHWHSGAQGEPGPLLTPEDVVSTIRLLTSPASEIPNRERFAAVASAEKTGPHTLSVHFRRALTDPLRYMLLKVLPAHLLGAATTLRRDSEFARHPVGTGPYAFVQANRQGEILLTANHGYFRGAPALERVVMKAYADQNIMAQSLMFHSLDLVTYVSPRDLGEIMGDNQLNLVPYDALSFAFVGLNTSRGVLRDKRVRQAISHAINRQEMLDAFFQGKGRLISGPFPPTSWAYNLEVKPLAFDLSRAKALLRAAGLREKDGQLLGPNGDRVSLTFAVPLAGESEMIKRVVLALQGYLEALGIKVELQFMDWLVWKQKVLAEHDYDLTIASWSFDDASNITSLFHSSSAKPWGNNFVLFRSPDVDSLLTEADVTNDFDKRRAIYHKLHAVLADEAPYTFLWTLMHHAAHTTRLSGVRIEPTAFFKHIVEWRMEPDTHVAD